MDKFAPIIVLFVIFSVISSVVRTAKMKAAQEQKQNGERAARIRAETEAARQQRLELARQQLQYRQQQLQNIEQRLRAEQTGSQTVPDKPIIPHSTDDCTGGSIHDGYHEGTIRRPQAASSQEGFQGAQGARRANYTPGRTGQGMAFKEGEASENHSALTTAELAARAPVKTESGAEKLVKSIASQPAIVQGVIWSEILGKPLSEQ